MSLDVMRRTYAACSAVCDRYGHVAAAADPTPAGFAPSAASVGSNLPDLAPCQRDDQQSRRVPVGRMRCARCATRT